jgi:hypothetical protein
MSKIQNPPAGLWTATPTSKSPLCRPPVRLDKLCFTTMEALDSVGKHLQRHGICRRTRPTDIGFPSYTKQSIACRDKHKIYARNADCGMRNVSETSSRRWLGNIKHNDLKHTRYILSSLTTMHAFSDSNAVGSRPTHRHALIYPKMP